MGLERVAAVLQGTTNVYATDAFAPIIATVDALSQDRAIGINDGRSTRIIADHVKAASFIIADGVRPSNVDQGYVLRRLIRRAVVNGRELGIEGAFTAKVAEKIIAQYGQAYSMLIERKADIVDALQKEEAQFQKTLQQALHIFDKKTEVKVSGDSVTVTRPVMGGDEAFDLVTTYGMPFEMVKEQAADRGIHLSDTFDVDFQRLFEEHQAKSRAGAEQKFKGGLADHSAETTKLHTATHLLNAALQKVLGPHVQQKGSNITAERLRFDFNHADKMTPEQVKEVERIVNEAIAADYPVSYHVTTVDGAKAEGAIGVFDDRYGADVKVYVVGDANGAFSKEICGGPHVARTGMIGSFTIQKEESSSAGVRRIKAVVKGGPVEINVATEQ
jgi:alanyl-tRNA synthetase